MEKEIISMIMSKLGKSGADKAKAAFKSEDAYRKEMKRRGSMGGRRKSELSTGKPTKRLAK